MLQLCIMHSKFRLFFAYTLSIFIPIISFSVSLHGTHLQVAGLSVPGKSSQTWPGGHCTSPQLPEKYRSYLANMPVKFTPPYTPLIYSKTGVCRGIHFFFFFALKQRLWVLVRTVIDAL